MQQLTVLNASPLAKVDGFGVLQQLQLHQKKIGMIASIYFLHYYNQ
jgi:hypothetical protein